MSHRVLITGANGFLGARCVARWAAAQDCTIVATWHRGRTRIAEPPPANVELVQCDLTDLVQVQRLFEPAPFDAVIHTAALLPDGDSAFLTRSVATNVLATALLADAAVGRTRCFVYCSSISVYGALPCPPDGWTEELTPAPDSIYGWTKYAGELGVRSAALGGAFRGVSLRLAGIHGRGRAGGAVFHMTRAAMAHQPLLVNGAVGTPFQVVFVDDAVDALWAAGRAELPAPYECLNVASHTFASLAEMAAEIVQGAASASDVRVEGSGHAGPQHMDISRAARVLRLVPAARGAHFADLRAWIRQLEAHG